MPDETMPAEPETQGVELTPLDFSRWGYVPGRYAPWRCSPEPVYGPDELGEYVKGVEELNESVKRCDAAARIWEVLQAWEMRLFRRNYQFLNAGWKGWGQWGGSAGASGAAILQTQNAMKLFSCNVFGARHKKITALLSRQVPGTTIAPVDDEDPMDQAASEEAEKFLDVYRYQSDLKGVVTKTAGLFCTDDRVGLLTYTVADETRWGTELPNRKQGVYGAEESDGVTPETEMDQEGGDSGEPARREVTVVGGKLEWKVPIMADSEEDMGWTRYQHEISNNLMRACYPWIREQIGTQGNDTGADQIARLARINVRLAVQASSTSGEAHKNDSTESVTFFKPSEYEGISDDDVRELFYKNFPDGLEVWHAGGVFAFCRNAKMSSHVAIVHPGPGDGQNREALLTNYLPLQKVLNANISLIDRYFRSSVPRRYAREPYIDTQAVNAQSNDPKNLTAVYIAEGSPLKIADLFGVESAPQPNDAIFQFIQWLIQGGPDAMDGGSPAAFGEADGSRDEGVYATTRLKRDQALQVFSMPWASLCQAVCAICQQAVESAAQNRVSDISASLPGQKKLKVEIEKLRGSVLVHPESLEIPQTMAEQEAQMAQLLEQSSNVALYQQIMTDPRNLSVFSQFPSLSKLNIPGADQVEQQQGEFEILMKSGPVANPKLAQIQALMAQAPNEPEAQTPEGQQAIQQLQQQAQSLPPMVSTVPVAQDTSETHAIHAAISLGMLASPTGRKLKNGNDEQKAAYRNILCHWQEHMAMLKQLQPPREMEFKGSVSIDPSKFPPEAQAEMFEAMGLQMPPYALQTQEQEHEITEEQEGVTAEGVPVKRKVSVVGKPLS